MPSIPQSLLWISLVVLWLFVLVPMLINKRDTVRRTSDVALSTRVLNSGSSRLLRRRGPAAGHHHDPEWRRDAGDLDDEFGELEPEDYDEAVSQAVREAQVRSHTRAVMVVTSTAESEAATEPVYLDVDVVEDSSGALPVGAGVQQALFGADPESQADAEPGVQVFAEPVPLPDAEPEPEPPTAPEAEAGAGDRHQDAGDRDAGVPLGDEYEYVDDTSGLEESDEPVTRTVPRVSRRSRWESTAAAVSARKYRFRKRVISVMAAVLLLTAMLSLTVGSQFWWVCGATGAVTVLYLAYLRRQTRIEEQVRRRRQQRLARSRMGEGPVADRVVSPDFDVVPSRLGRPGAAVLEIDDEDPAFDHLDEVRYSRRYDLPRAAGQ